MIKQKPHYTCRLLRFDGSVGRKAIFFLVVNVNVTCWCDAVPFLWIQVRSSAMLFLERHSSTKATSDHTDTHIPMTGSNAFSAVNRRKNLSMLLSTVHFQTNHAPKIFAWLKQFSWGRCNWFFALATTSAPVLRVSIGKTALHLL